MTNGLSEPNHTKRSGEFAADSFFYSNLRIQETIASLRYGIEARKGLTVLTGAAGAGKTALLRKTASGLAANVTCVFQSDPRVSFIDILWLLVATLAIDHPGQDESSLLRSCRLELRSRLAKCQIVALFFDDADQLPDQTLRYIVQNFLTGSAEDAEGTLLQVVLAGRPELKIKLAGSTLMALKRRKPILHEIEPLQSGEIAAFIAAGLQTIDKSPDTFDERAIKRIGLYANGNPGTVHAICRRALALTAGSPSTVTTELIETVVAELGIGGLGESSGPEGMTAPHTARHLDKDQRIEAFVTDDYHAPFRFSASEELPGPARFPYDTEFQEVNFVPRKKRSTAWAQRLAILILLTGAIAGTGAMIGKDTVYDVAGRLRASLDAALERQVETEKPAAVPAEKTVMNELLVPVPGPDRPSKNEEQPRAAALPENQPFAPTPSDSRSADESRRDERRVSQPASAPAPPHSRGQNEYLQRQVAKAIESRAIMGVEVSVVEGTAFLDGRVASERQRRAAERAARSVAGVERVRNRIAITFG